MPYANKNTTNYMRSRLRSVLMTAVATTAVWWTGVAAAGINGDLIGAADRGDLATVQHLLNAGANPNARDGWGSMTYTDTVLMHAARAGHADIVKALISKGADINGTNEFGETALMKAAAFGQVSTTRLLLLDGADISVRSRKGQTALMMASAAGHEDTVRTLLANGTDINPGVNANGGGLAVEVENHNAAIANSSEQIGAPAPDASDRPANVAQPPTDSTSRWRNLKEGMSTSEVSALIPEFGQLPVPVSLFVQNAKLGRKQLMRTADQQMVSCADQTLRYSSLKSPGFFFVFKDDRLISWATTAEQLPALPPC